MAPHQERFEVVDVACHGTTNGATGYTCAEFDKEDHEFFAEVLALITDAQTSSEDDDTVTTNTRPAIAKKKAYSVGSVARRKRTIDGLKLEEKQLQDRVRELEIVRMGPLFPAKHRAITERARRHQAERDGTALRLALDKQTRFLYELWGFFKAAPDSLLFRPSM